MDYVEARSLNGSVWTERHVQATALRHNGVRQGACRAAESANQRRRIVVAVEYFHPVVGALQVSLQLEIGERLCKPQERQATGRPRKE